MTNEDVKLSLTDVLHLAAAYVEMEAYLRASGDKMECVRESKRARKKFLRDIVAAAKGRAEDAARIVRCAFVAPGHEAWAESESIRKGFVAESIKATVDYDLEECEPTPAEKEMVDDYE